MCKLSVKKIFNLSHTLNKRICKKNFEILKEVSTNISIFWDIPKHLSVICLLLFTLLFSLTLKMEIILRSDTSIGSQ
jgi:hypothetical protein